MRNSVIEAKYPIVFRRDLALILGQHIKARQSVVLIGMKRVGISNFLRFFLYHKNILPVYIGDSKNHIFIPVDLNDLVELDIYPFWALVFKRIVDALEESKVEKKVKNEIQSLFLDSIQSRDSFITIDSVRRSLVRIVETGFLPTLFFIRFDRIKDIVSGEFFANLQGLKDSTHHKLCYVFTSFRSLDVLSSYVFSRNTYIKPAKKEDTKIIFKMYTRHSGVRLSGKIEKELFDAVDGYVQYLQLALVSLAEKDGLPVEEKNIFEYLVNDERIVLASEELWESLEDQEKSLLVKIANKVLITNTEIERSKYLWDTGLVIEKNKSIRIFSSIFEYYVRGLEKKGSSYFVEFTKKENLLFKHLLENHDAVCERDQIVKAVWSEVEELGVSDWAIDRLVARVRNKLKLQKTNYEIKTVKTRGYKLIEA